MLRTLALSACLLAATGCSGCNEDSLAEAGDAGPEIEGLTPQQAARVVAKVGDRTITLGDVASTLARMDEFDRLRYQTKERRRELLDEMIDIELLAIEAERRGIDKAPATQEAVRQILRDALLAEARLAAPAPAEISADRVRAYYEKNIEQYREPERRRVSALVLDDEAAAEKALEELAAVEGADARDKKWGEMFRERGLIPKDEPADLAGDLGLVGPPGDPKGDNPAVPAPVQKAVYEIGKVGEVLPRVVPAGGRFFVVRLSGQTQAHQRSLAEADRSIRVAIIQAELEELEAELEGKLRKELEVKIDEEALARVPLPSAVEGGGEVGSGASRYPGQPPAPSGSPPAGDAGP